MKKGTIAKGLTMASRVMSGLKSIAPLCPFGRLFRPLGGAF